MAPPVPPLLFALLLLAGMLALLETGRRIGIRRQSKESEGERGGLGTIEGAVFALFGLMVAFTFSGALCGDLPSLCDGFAPRSAAIAAPRASARSSICAGVRRSVIATRRPSSNSPYSRPSA